MAADKHLSSAITAVNDHGFSYLLTLLSNALPHYCIN